MSRRSLTSQSLKLKDACGMCSVPGSSEYPCILSACLVSLEPETGLRIMAGKNLTWRMNQAAVVLLCGDQGGSVMVMGYFIDPHKQPRHIAFFKWGEWLRVNLLMQVCIVQKLLEACHGSIQKVLIYNHLIFKTSSIRSVDEGIGKARWI